ncbi:LysR family transcriptional regulator [Nocardioides kongjuensis]|uniref:DNA-binding transcriptional LysR family regulator n=1 Tax=Nocardioides kongjuensis TaxID=349522 RepID=A0A852RMV3_9ACTN|nr:LysR family transcriptional regulator [Nocardioides kongjuensis]NYD30616.1 DNA-binding transcriptional LysR family regulator [Nocardioides kongjuensis]
MERRQLEYFVAVVDQGGFGRASEAVHVTQPSLSQAIAALEKDLGVTLFHRLGRKVKLTAAGEALLAPARQVLRDHAVARAAVAKVRGGYDGTLDIASTPTVAAHPLTALLGRFSQLYPGINVRITDCDVPGGAAAIVGGGQCEIGVVRLPAATTGLQAIALGEQEFFLVLPPDSPDPGPGPVELSVLAELPLIATPPGTASRKRLDDSLAIANVTEPRIVVETIYRATIPKLVAAGVGASLLPRHMAQEAAELGARVVATTPAVAHEIGIVRREGPLSPAARAFIDLALEMAPFGAEGEQP